MSIAYIPLDLLKPATRGFAHFVALLTAVMASLVLTFPAAASENAAITISTAKPLGPALGTFSTVGAFADFGILVTVDRNVSALPAPFGVVTHLVLRLEGQQGTFTIRTQIRESATEDPNIFFNQGVWVIVEGTGAYSTLRGTGNMQGTVNDAENLISRFYTGLVHFN